MFVVGLAVGTGLMWWLYVRDLERKLQTAVAEQVKLKQQFTQHLILQKDPSVDVGNELAQFKANLEQAQAELATAEVEISDLQNKFKRVSSDAEKWGQENRTLRAKLVTAVNEAKQFQDQLTQTRQHLTDLQTEKGRVSQRLALAEAEFKQWQKEHQAEPAGATAVAPPPADEITDNLTQQLKTTETYIASLKEQISNLKTQHEETQQLRHQLSLAQDNLRVANAEINSLQFLLANDDEPISNQLDILQEINGIGPAFALKLYESGIYTFDQLAHATREEIADIIEVNTSDIEEWLEEARQLAGEK